ncbi:MAG: magnesium chelatase family protein [Clostridia bacterium]|jgi:magnesium chelatase family protein|nr:Mg chelatase, subunit ChlI [Clostridiales bacterium]MDK2984711.1 magnesium chelatase family protein [Clostridia bacterium]
MLAIVNSCSLLGLKGFNVKVEVDVSGGLPGFHMVGLPDTSVRESRERVKAAIKNSGFKFPPKQITVNLAPADIRKEGSAFDLPIALGILAATEQIPLSALEGKIVVGELSLNGDVRPLNGVLAMVSATENETMEFLVPQQNSYEAALSGSNTVYGVSSLNEAAHFLTGKTEIPQTHVDISEIFSDQEARYEVDMEQIKGQESAKRALEIAAAGNHNVLMVGPPGTGKTLLAKALPSILPGLTLEETLQITKIYSISGLLPEGIPLVKKRPFRAPHHNASTASLIGGGTIPKPGEVTLATHGVLFLDELTEFDRKVLDALRQPLEDGSVTISRVNAAVTYPTNFILITAMNPCNCGFLSDPERECTCTPYAISRYLTKISGPLLDRIDLQVEVPRLKYEELHDYKKGETSAEIKKRVEAARKIQRERFKDYPGVECNSQMDGELINKFCALDKNTEEFYKQVFDSLKLSIRMHNRILKIARTIADLEGNDKISEHNLAEAVQYRDYDRLLADSQVFS